MNKYQEALNKIVKSCCPNCVDENGCSSCDIKKICNATAKDWVNRLQELIDKETPKKAIEFTSEITNSEEAYTFYTCPKCRMLLSNDIYCPKCGQKIDWSEKDE